MQRVLLAFVPSALLALGLAIQPLRAVDNQAAGRYAQFVGSWSHHGFSLEVTADGTAFAVYRLYAWCGARQHAGCDRLIGQQMYLGGVWAAYLQTPKGMSVSGVIGASADTSLDGTAVRLVRAPHDLLLLTWGTSKHRMQLTLCGPQALASTRACGA